MTVSVVSVKSSRIQSIHDQPDLRPFTAKACELQIDKHAVVPVEIVLDEPRH